MKKLLLIITFTFVISIFFGCDNSVNCVEEFASIQEIIAPDTVNVNESINIEIVYWLSCQSFERVEERVTDSTANFKIIVCDELASNPGIDCAHVVHIDTFRKQIDFTKKGKFKIIVNDSSKIKEIEVK